jgi:hypothetical protein
MDINNCIFSGKVEWSKEQRIAPRAWGNINTRIGLPKFEFQFKDELKQVERPNVWLSIRTSYTEGGKLQEKHQEVLDHCTNGAYIMVMNSSVSDYEVMPKDENGNVIMGAPKEKRFSLNVSPSNVFFSQSPFDDMNMGIFSGYVSEVKSSGYVLVKSSYRNKEGLSYRQIPIVTNEKVDSSLKSSRVLVIGSVCGKTPGRETKLYVVSKKIIRLS